MLYVNKQLVPQSALDEHYHRLRLEVEKELDGKPEELIHLTTLEHAKNYVIEEALLDQEVNRIQAHISSKEVTEAFQQMLDMNGGEDAFKKHYSKADEAKIKAEIIHQKRKEMLLASIDATVPETSDDAMLAYYEANKDKYMEPDFYHASYIVKIVLPDTDRAAAEKGIREAHRRLASGEDFASVVLACSDNKEHDGDMGWFPKGAALPMFEDTLDALKPGEFSEPFVFTLGWSIVKLHELRKGQVIKFELVKEDIRSLLAEDAKDAAFRQFVEDLKATASVETK